MKKPYLNVGCGFQHHPAWVNIDFVATGNDVIAHNLRHGLPFRDNSFEVVYHSHVLEHLPKSDAPAFLSECFRVLRPQGVMRVVIPDLEAICRLYLTAIDKATAGSQEWAHHYNWLLLEMYDQCVRHHSGGEMLAYLAQTEIPNQEFVIQRLGVEAESLINRLNQQRRDNSTSPISKPMNEEEIFWQEIIGDEAVTAFKIGLFRLNGEPHQWMYDRYSLSRLLQSQGFEQIRLCQPDQSSIPDFANYRLDTQPDGQTRKPDSLFMESIKPDPKDNASIGLAVDFGCEDDLRFFTTNRGDQGQVQKCQSWTELATLLTQAIKARESHLQDQQQRLEKELSEARETIASMESSKFWILRKAWLRLKHIFGKS
jgi:predicted SAM-dependent methyltransferase